MGFTDVVLTFIAATLSGAIVAWFFSSKEQQALTAERVRKLSSLSFKIIVLCMGCLGLAKCVHVFILFAKADAPISRIEIVELFVYFLNFLVFLIATTSFAAIWRHQVLRASNKNPAEAGLDVTPKDAK